MYRDPAIQAAYAECVRTHRGEPSSPCLLPEYLRARAVFHALLVQAGLLDPKLAEKAPAE